MSLVALPAIALAFFLAGAWITAAVGYPLFNAAVAQRPGLARASLLMASVPVLVGAALALSAFLPGDPHLDRLLGCHCATSMPGWLHLCPLHPTTAPEVLLPTAAVLFLLVPGRIRALGVLFREPLGTGTGAEPTLVDLPRPMALLAGWLRPSLLVDRRLWASLDAQQRQAVLAHERAHLARRDPLMLATLRLLTSVAPKAAAHRMMRQWLDRAELRADAAAASQVDPLTIADALLACARLAPASNVLQLGWTSGSLETRVRALVDLRPGGSHTAGPDAGLVDLIVVAVALVAGLSRVPWLHHQVEHLLNLAL